MPLISNKKSRAREDSSRRSLCENLYLTRDDQTLFEVLDDYPIN